ncbi:MAG: SRPBCC family protein [Chloroflexota bacterium]|nr:SRPBCC family protein [Chloroflexota bacterium]
MTGPREPIFALGAAIEDWPMMLPHYRSVLLTERTVQPDGTIQKIATMKAWRLLPFGKIPVGWKTIQESNPATGLLHFLHIGGFTKGMDVYWLLKPEGDATRVTITHDFTLKWPLIGKFVAHRIVGQFFVDAIARRTLRCIKAMVEGNLTSQPPLHCDGEGKQDSVRAVQPPLSRMAGEGLGVGAVCG